MTLLLHFLKVIVNKSLGASDPVQTVGFTYPLPPKPVYYKMKKKILVMLPYWYIWTCYLLIDILIFL